MALPFLEMNLAQIADMAAYVRARHPDRIRQIGSGPTCLATRTIMQRDDYSAVYFHEWHRSDPDDLHDHPWQFVRLIVSVGYWEVTEEKGTLPTDGVPTRRRTWCPPGSVKFLAATDRHRVEVDPAQPMPTSLIICGPETREWGFHTAKGFVVGNVYRADPSRYKAAS